MKKKNKKYFYIAVCMIIAFLSWTVAVCFIDVSAIGPKKSSVGFSTINGFIHNLTGVNMPLYIITDWLGLVPFCFIIGFAMTGLMQWIKRKSLLKVDYSILVLGGFYIVVMMVYILFEIVVVNYRPVLIDGFLEASYPSSTTMLVMCVMPTAIMQFNTRIKNMFLRRIISFISIAFVIFMVIARLVSGVHWFSDIIGGVLISGGLVMMYYYVCSLNSR